MKKVLIYLFVLFPGISAGQKVLSLQELTDLALKNNFDIQIARNNVEIDKIKNSYGYAGGLPTITGNAGNDNAIMNIRNEFSDGTTGNYSNASNYSFEAGITGSMVLFNGFKIMATKQRLNDLQHQSEILLNQQIQNTIAAVSLKYYDIIRQENYLKIIQNSLDFSQKKLTILNERDKVGMAKPADVLQVQMDVNNAEQNIQLQQLIIEHDKADLLLLIGENNDFPFEINDSIFVDFNLQIDSINLFIDQNPQYLLVENQIHIYEQNLREISAQRYPSLRVNAGYQFSNAFYNYGSTEMNQTFGPWAGLSLQIPIFNGTIYGTQKKTGELNLENARLEKEKVRQNLKSDVYKTWMTYSIALKQIESQRKNYKMALKIVNILMQNFQLNQATILDMKEAQTLFENAAYLLINLQYSAKVAEIELNRLTYRLK
jgi:outer membrane protein